MENVHNAIAWYQTKIGSYDKQLWEQSVEKKLQKQPPFVLHNAPRKKVRLKTEYIDVDLIRGSTFTKTKPQVPWVYITRKAIARVLFFPFYYNWWVHQTSKRLYAVLLILYTLQVVTVFVYLRNFDHSIMEDEVSFTEVTLPAILMFLLCLIHSQTVLAHINHKPPKRNKNISGVTRKPHPKKASRKGRSSGNNSTCQEDGGNTDTSKTSRRQTQVSDANFESHSYGSASDTATPKNLEVPIKPSIDMENNLMSRSVSDYELKPATSPAQGDLPNSGSSVRQRRRDSHTALRDSASACATSGWHQDKDSSVRVQNSHHDENIYIVQSHTKWRDETEGRTHVHTQPGHSYSLLDNLPNLLTVEKVCCDIDVQTFTDCQDVAATSRGQGRSGSRRRSQDNRSGHVSSHPEEKCTDSKGNSRECNVVHVSDNLVNRQDVGRGKPSAFRSCDHRYTATDSELSMCFVQADHEVATCSCSHVNARKSPILPRVETNDDVDLELHACKTKLPNGDLNMLDVLTSGPSKAVSERVDVCNSKPSKIDLCRSDLSHVDLGKATMSRSKPSKFDLNVIDLHNGEALTIGDVYTDKLSKSDLDAVPLCRQEPPGLDVDLGVDLCSIDLSSVDTDLSVIICSQTSLHDGSSTDSKNSVSDITPKKYPQTVSDVLFECPNGSDNISMSDFEIIDHLVVHDKHSLQIRASPTCPSSQGNSTVTTAAADSVAQSCQSCNQSAKHKLLKSQDSSDSGIINEVCSCTSPHDTEACSSCECTSGRKWQTDATSGVEDTEEASVGSGRLYLHKACGHEREFSYVSSQTDSHSEFSQDSCLTLSESKDLATVNSSQSLSQCTVIAKHPHNTENDISRELKSEPSDGYGHLSSSDMISSGPEDKGSVKIRKNTSEDLPSQNHLPSQSDSSSHLQCFSELFVQEILNEDTLREVSCTSLLAHSDLENSSSSAGHLSAASTASSASSSCRNSHNIPSPTALPRKVQEPAQQPHHSPQSCPNQRRGSDSARQDFPEKVKTLTSLDNEKNDPLDESLENINLSDGDRPSDDVSNYNPSDSDADSDGLVNEDIRNRYEEKLKRLRFQELVGNNSPERVGLSKSSTNVGSGTAGPGSSLSGGGSRSVVGILTRKPSPLKDLAIGRKPSSNTTVPNTSGSEQEHSDAHNQLRRRRRTSGTTTEPTESSRTRNVPTTLGLRPADAKERHISSSENETGEAHTPEGSNKATMSSEEWEDRMQSDETTSSAYSSNSEVDTDEKIEEEEKTEYTTSTLHVINLLQPQSGSPSSSGNITQPDRVSCVIWEGNECKKVDLTALDIGWAIIDKVDSLPESSDYFLIGLLFSLLISIVPLVFRAYNSKDPATLDELLSWSGIMSRFIELPALITSSYSWRQYLLMINGILQRFFLSLTFFFLLSVADRTFKQRLLYAKHFSYLTSSRRARKFTMPHFRLNKVRNIKIWLSLRSYLKRRGPQRSVDVIVSACFLCAVCTVCLISLQMLKDTTSYLDYLCNWELLVWCTALAVFLMRFMTIGLKINKKYRNLSVLITEQINLYLQMEQKPHKKEELILANNVLRLAEDLLKELESPFKISGFSANPLIYNIMRVVVLSAFSAVLTEVLGFKLKLHKIKLKG